MALSLLLATVLLAPPTPAEAREILGRSVPDAISVYQQWDAFFRNGQGYSDRVTSGGLGWAEASFLRNYASAWRVTHDTWWLDKFSDHFNRILASQQPNGDGFLAWNDTDYSVGLLELAAAEGADGLSLTPDRHRLYVNSRGGETVTGHRYELAFTAPDRLRLRDLTSGEVQLEQDYAGELQLDVLRGRAYADAAAAKADGAVGVFKLTGPGRTGARFTIATTAPAALEFVVHDGMITYPMAQFIEFVRTEPDLDPKYRAAADRYLAWFHRNIYEKWEPYWVEVDAKAGAYTFTADPTERYPSYLLPHNQYLALARAYLVLQELDDLPEAPLYRAKAEKMARYFQRHLKDQLDGQAYLWNYWDPPAGQEVRRNPEDYSHATIDVGFVAEAARRGFVFGPSDAVKLARTYTDVMGNGDLADARLSHNVAGTPPKDNRIGWDWALLGEWDAAAFQFAKAMFDETTAGPQLGEVIARLGEITGEERAAARDNSARLADLLNGEGQLNGGFEWGTGNTLFRWYFATWSKQSGDGRFEWSTDAYAGKRSAALVATEGTPNLVLQTQLQFTAPTRLEIRFQYKTSGEARPFLSLIAEVPGGERQYDSSEPFPRSETWRSASWTVTSAAGATTGDLTFRNSGFGTVWYDAVEISTSR